MKKSIKEIEDAIILHKNLYYQGKAKISDEDYDLLEEELKERSPESPILQMVGSTTKLNQKIRHEKKMLSLEKTYEQEKLKKWMGDHEVLSTFKYDGSACSLVYQEGLLSIAKTRGDGQFGENIQKKVFYIENIPKRIEENSKIEIRGEIYCTHEDFIELSKEMEKQGLDLPTSLRNIVAGILGRKDRDELCRFLKFTAFELNSHIKLKKEEEKFIQLKKLNFSLPTYALCKNWNELNEQIKKCQQFFNNGNYLIDGLVIVYNDSNLAEELGETSHHPKNKIAFKFKGESKVSKILSIEWNISRNGRCTPVALVEPVELSGAIVSRVTLHHYGMVQAFKLMPGTEIEIVRSGEVIPKFLRVVKPVDQKFIALKNCPSCHSELYVDGHWLKCQNKNCIQRKEQEILYFIKSLGIEEISEMRLREMMIKKLVSEITDLFKLKKEDFLILDKIKEKLAQKFYEQIQKAKEVSLVAFIAALGIEGLGETKIEKIINAGFNSIGKISELKINDLLGIDGFAEKSSQAIISGIDENRILIKSLLDVGFIFKNNDQENVKSSIEFKNLKFCITGTLSQPRDEIINFIKIHSGIIQDNVNKETNYLITNDKESSSSKFVKAKKFGIPIISEESLKNLIKG